MARNIHHGIFAPYDTWPTHRGDPVSLAEATSVVKVASIWPSYWFGSGTYVNYIFISKIAILIWCTSPDLTLYRVPGLCQSVMHEINIFPLICKQVLFGLLFKPDLVTGKIVEIGSLRSNIHLVSLYIYIHFIVFCTLARINWSIIFFVVYSYNAYPTERRW